jgi:RNA recognition motif-containing protein
MSKQKINQQDHSIKITNLSNQLSREDIRKLFKECGEIKYLPF